MGAIEWQGPDSIQGSWQGIQINIVTQDDRDGRFLLEL